MCSHGLYCTGYDYNSSPCCHNEVIWDNMCYVACSPYARQWNIPLMRTTYSQAAINCPVFRDGSFLGIHGSYEEHSMCCKYFAPE